MLIFIFIIFNLFYKFILLENWTYLFNYSSENSVIGSLGYFLLKEQSNRQVHNKLLGMVYIKKYDKSTKIWNNDILNLDIRV